MTKREGGKENGNQRKGREKRGKRREAGMGKVEKEGI